MLALTFLCVRSRSRSVVRSVKNIACVLIGFIHVARFILLWQCITQGLTFSTCNSQTRSQTNSCAVHI